MCVYQIGQRVTATVERVLPFGIFVRLDDGARAYIRRRELDIDPDTDPQHAVRESEKISAIVIELGVTGKHIELSRRKTLPDPLQEFISRLRLGDVVHGAVARLSPAGAYVRLAPGVNGFVPLSELARWSVAKPDDLLWVGDDVEAAVIEIETNSKKIWLSIRDYMKQREMATATAERLISLDDESISIANSRLTKTEDGINTITTEERDRVGFILIADDHDEIREPLATRLKQRGYQVATARTVTETLQQIEQHPSNVLLLDLHLPDGDGIEIARQALNSDQQPYVCLMSSPEWLEERDPEIREVEIDQVFSKPLDVDEIDAFLLRIAQDGEFRIEKRSPPREEALTPLRQLFAPQVQGQMYDQQLISAMRRTCQTINAEKGILFEMGPTSPTVSIVAEVGEISLHLEALYGLSNSPVKDVIRERKPVFANGIDEQARRRFGKLLDLLLFESCLGVPVDVFGDSRHAAFFFHRQMGVFPPPHSRDILLASFWFGAILEMQSLENRMRSSAALLLSGELSLGFSHEIYNKLSGIELMLLNLKSNTSNVEEQRAGFLGVGELVRGTKEIAVVFQQLIHAKEEYGTVDVNETLYRAEILIRPLARKERVSISFHLQSDLPPVLGSSVWFQQIFLNIMLNAIQQMALKADKHRQLEIKTLYEKEAERPIKIRFTDTGSGIHKQLWEKIFTLGFTTRRGGTGLGLFLVNNLLAGMGGTAKVEKSCIPLGTTFLIELPIFEETKKK